MNKFKKILPVLIFFLFPLFITHAADIEVYCDDDVDGDQCNIVSGSKLFDDDYLMPGETISRSILVTNDDHNDDCDLKMYTSGETSSPSDFVQRVFSAIKKNGFTIYGTLDSSDDATSNKNLRDIFNESYIDFGRVPMSGGTATYYWIITLDNSMGNGYQGAEASFDFSINFVCDHEESNNGDSDDNSSDSGTSGVSGASASFFSPITTLFVGGTESIEISEEEQPIVEGVHDETPDVFGVKECVDPWWWWVVFILQFFISWFIYVLIKDKHIDKRKRFYLLQILNTGVFMFIFWKNFCPWWDVLISLGIGLLWLILTRKRFKNIEKNLYSKKYTQKVK